MRGSYLKTLLLTGTLAAVLPFSSLAQVSYTGGVLTENFDSMGPNGTTPPAGWSVQLGGGNDVPAGPQAAYAPVTTLTVSAGEAAPVAGLAGYNHGPVGGANRSLGTGATGNSRCVDVFMQNNSGLTISAFKIGYTGRKWRQGSAQVQTDRYDVYYSPDGTLNSWQLLGPSLRYSSPNALPNSSQRDGLTAPNFQTIAPVNAAPATPIADGRTFYLRFWDHNPGDTDGHIAVDDFSFETDSLEPVLITSQPTSLTVNEGGAATFTVVATGSAPTYQWYSNGVAIAGATAATYTLNPALRDADNAQYYVVVANAAPSSEQSVTVTLDVIPDLTPPTFACAYQGASASEVIVVFSEPVNGVVGSEFEFELTSSDGGTIPAITSVGYQGGGGGPGNTMVVALFSAMDAGKTYAFGYIGEVNSVITDQYANVMVDQTTPIARYLVEQPLIQPDATTQWRYEASGANLGTAWTATGYDDSAWPQGPAILGVEGAFGFEGGVRTTFTPYVQATITYYFRAHFNYSGPAGPTAIQIETVFDDGGVVYVNGQEAYRLRMPAGAITYQTVATGGPATDPPTAYEGPFIGCANLVNGDNVIAVEVHQVNTGSSDVLMGLRVKPMLASITPVSFTQQPQSVTVAEGGTATFSVMAAGTAVQYQWSGPNGLITDATNATLTISPVSCDPSDAGNYVCEIYNAVSGPIASMPATLTIICDETAPTVECAFGTNGVVVVHFTEQTTGGDVAGSYTITGSDSSTIVVTAAAYTSGGGTGNVAVLTLASGMTPNLGYTVTATSFSDLYGNATASSTKPIALFSTPTLLPVSATWRYENTGTDLGTGWEATAFNDSGWAIGAGLFDSSRGANGMAGLNCRDTVSTIPVGTCITISNAANTAQIPSSYFRTHFTFSGNAANAVVCLRPVVDDGAVFYLNGVELTRLGMPAGPITYNSLATGRAAAVGTANYEGPIYACAPSLVSGDNVLAATVHQFNLTSSDLTFGVEASVLEITPPIVITITLNGDGSVTLTWPGGGSLITSTDVTAPRSTWSVVGGATSPHTIPAGSVVGNRFYSARNP